MKKIFLPVAFVASIVALSSFHAPFAAEPDKAFMIKAAQSNIAEINAAKLAQSKSTSDSVKSYAQMMIDEHTKAQADLASLAQTQGVTLPDSTDPEHRMLAQRMMLISGGTFDSAYAQSQVRDHVKTIALFQSEIAQGKNPQDKAFAVTLLPNLQMHLKHAQMLAGSSMAGMSMPQ